MATKEELLAEYERLKLERISPLERAGDFFSGIDERLDFLAGVLFGAVEEQKEIKGALAQLLEGLAQLPEGVAVPMRTEQIPYSYTLAKAGEEGSGVTLVEYAPFPGYLKEVSIHWPAGCDHLADVAVGHSNVQFCPREGFLALNDATPTYPFEGVWVDEGEEIWVKLQNRDGGNTHDITVSIIIEGTAL